MIGRFLLGAGLGGLVGTGVLALASVVAPGPGMSPPGAVAPAETPAETPPEASAPDTPAPEAAPEAATGAAPEAAKAEPGATPDAAAPEASAEAAPGAAPTGTGTEPETAADPATAEAAPEPPAAPPQASAEAPAAPAVPEPGTAANAPAEEAPAVAAAADPAAPQAPAAEAAPAAPETPAAAPALAADIAEPPAAPAATAAAEPVVPPAPPAEAPAAATDPAQPLVPVAEAAPNPADPPGPPPLTPEEEAMLAEIAAKGPEALPDLADLPAAPDVAEAAPMPAPAADPELPTAEGAPPVMPPAAEGTLEDDPARRVVVGEGSTLPSTPSLTEKAGEDADTGGLPTIGDPATAEKPAESTRPLDLYARAFENPDAKPLFAVLLIDSGEADLDRATLAALPFPVTFAIDPLAEGAADRARIYRDAGQEVVMLASGVPQGATASDVEQAFQIMDQALPEAVAVMDLPDPAFQGDRPLASLVVPVVGAQGRGLVTWDAGLNAADQVARREDVPAAVVFRDLDAEGEAAPVIRRYLDRAAFKAAQEGRVTVVGRTRPETIAALLEWTVEGRAATVALAPVTAVLSID